MPIEAAGAAGRQHGVPGQQGMQLAGGVETAGAPAMAGGIGHQLDGAQVVAHRDVSVCADMAFQSLDHRSTGGVVGVNDASRAVAAFPGKVIGIAGLRVWVGSEGDAQRQ